MSWMSHSKILQTHHFSWRSKRGIGSLRSFFNRLHVRRVCTRVSVFVKTCQLFHECLATICVMLDAQGKFDSVRTPFPYTSPLLSCMINSLCSLSMWCLWAQHCSRCVCVMYNPLTRSGCSCRSWCSVLLRLDVCNACIPACIACRARTRLLPPMRAVRTSHPTHYAGSL